VEPELELNCHLKEVHSYASYPRGSDQAHDPGVRTLGPTERPETKDPWTVKDALAHISHWKADVVRKIKRLPIPPEEKGLNETDGNHLVYERWRDRSPQEVLAWHRRVQKDVLTALQDAPEKWFSGRERRPEWPFDLDGHSSYHRVKDIEQALQEPGK
jgi:hypothetical protein